MEITADDRGGLPQHENLRLTLKTVDDEPGDELTDKQYRILEAVLERGIVDQSGRMDVSPVRNRLRDQYDDMEGSSSYIWQIIGEHVLKIPPGYDLVPVDDAVASGDGMNVQPPNTPEGAQEFINGYREGWADAMSFAQSVNQL